jgi:hypothetical protein
MNEGHASVLTFEALMSAGRETASRADIHLDREKRHRIERVVLQYAADGSAPIEPTRM